MPIQGQLVAQRLSKMPFQGQLDAIRLPKWRAKAIEAFDSAEIIQSSAIATQLQYLNSVRLY